MTWVTGILVYVIVWWLVLFTVLPFGARPPDDPQPGTVPSAPARPRMWLKMGVTSAIAALIWVAIRYVVVHDMFGFREFVGSN